MTTWRLKHKLMLVKNECEADRGLSARVEVDYAYLSELHGRKVGRGAYEKAPFVMEVQTIGDVAFPWHVNLDPLFSLTRKALAQWTQEALASSTEAFLVSEGLAAVCLVTATDLVSAHKRVIVSERKSSELDCFYWENSLLSNIKISILGAFHRSTFDGYPSCYVGESQYHFIRRFYPV